VKVQLSSITGPIFSLNTRLCASKAANTCFCRRDLSKTRVQTLQGLIFVANQGRKCIACSFKQSQSKWRSDWLDRREAIDRVNSE
jgi:hypothetical protein